MDKRRLISIFLLAIILFISSGQVIASEEEETIKSEIIPIRGGALNSPDEALRVEIDEGIYYRPVTLTIEELKWELYKDRYISASKVHSISIDNPLERYAEDRKIKISFEYYGKKDGGIYLNENASWTYLPSTVEDGSISTYVNPSTLSKKENIFTVLVDTKAETFYDTRGHWAREEIKTYTRRGLINGYPDKTFKPDRHITRAEFLMLLSRVEKWKLPDDTSNNEYFKDLEKFNEYNEKQISYSHSHNYIRGYADGYFRPYNHISYREVEIIMRRVLDDPDFSWKAYAEKMIYDKRVRSSSYDSYNNNITRAEFSYMLYKLNEWKY